MLHKCIIQNKCCSFELSIHQIILKKTCHSIGSRLEELKDLRRVGRPALNIPLDTLACVEFSIVLSKNMQTFAIDEV